MEHEPLSANRISKPRFSGDGLAPAWLSFWACSLGVLASRAAGQPAVFVQMRHWCVLFQLML